MGEHDELAAVVGRKVRAIREGARRSQEDLAAAADGAGLPWTRAAVASLETGRRNLTAMELLLLPVALGDLDGASHTLAELLDDAPDILQTPSGAAIATELLRSIAEGEPTEDAEARERRFAAPVAHEALLVFLGRREAERHAARKLGQEPDQVVWIAYQLWGHGLTEEREARLAGRVEDEDPRRLQALRGHVTRELLTELRQAMEGHDG